jgi:hypothetical protein
VDRVWHLDNSDLQGFCSEEEGEERVFVSWTRMTSCIRYEDRLEGISNYLQWKVRIAIVLKENKLWMFVSTTVPVPSSNPIAVIAQVVGWEKPDPTTKWRQL